MKKIYLIAVLLVLMGGFGLMAVPCFAEEQERPVPAERVGSEHRGDRIEMMLDRLAEVDPNRAEELRKLQKENPEKFGQEMREEFRNRMSGKSKEGMNRPQPMDRQEQMRGKQRDSGRDMNDRRGIEAGPLRDGMRGKQRGSDEGADGRRGMGGGHEKGERNRMLEKYEEFYKWLGENYPEQTKKLEKLREEKPELYRRQMAVTLKKYGRIYEASKKNPELAAVLKEDIVLTEKRDGLLKEIAAASEDKKEELTSDLKDVLGQRYDLILRRKEIAYKELSKKLEELQAEAGKKEAELDKWKDPAVKSQNVDAHLKELIKGTETFKWD